MEHSEDDSIQESKPSRVRTVAFSIVGFIFVAASIGTGLLTNEPPRVAGVRLSDGRIVTVRTVTFGTAHHADRETGLRKRLRSISPWLSRKILGAPPPPITIPIVAGSSPLVAWINVSGTNGTKSTVNRVRMLAPTGQTFKASEIGHTDEWKDLPLWTTFFDVFPRRYQFLTLTGTVDKLPFSIQFENPLYGKSYPVWKTTTLPATNMAGPFEVVLTTNSYVNPEGRHRQFRPHFEVYRDGELLPDSFAFAYPLTDPTGNNAWSIPFDEPAWRVNISMSRTRGELLLTNEFKEFTVDRIPPVTNYAQVDMFQKINGVEVYRLWVGGPGDFFFENGELISVKRRKNPRQFTDTRTYKRGGNWAFDWGATQHWAVCHLEHPATNQSFGLFVHDAEGKPIKTAWASRSSATTSGGSGYRSLYQCLLEVPDQRHPSDRNKPLMSFEEYVKPPITIRVAAHEKFTTEFFVDPRKLRRNFPTK